METKIHSYKTDEITVTYDVKRCLHAAECIKGLRDVFDPDKRPWIQPGNAPVDRIADTVTRCPTGALHFERKDGGKGESAAAQNTISLFPDGPVYIRGNIEVQDHEGNIRLQDTRFAMCRCGQSKNKPACDNSHNKTGFEAPASFDVSSLKEENPKNDGDKLILKLMENGPVLVEGSYQMYSYASQPVSCSKNIALCRCGGSSDKPFCDGTHKKIGFQS